MVGRRVKLPDNWKLPPECQHFAFIVWTRTIRTGYAVSAAGTTLHGIGGYFGQYGLGL